MPVNKVRAAGAGSIRTGHEKILTSDSSAHFNGNGDFARGDGAAGIDKQVTLQSEATLINNSVRSNKIRADTPAAHERSQS
jgi:hypothetical protein